MVVGAACRDILHYALGHRFPTSATHDLAVALSSWDAYRSIAALIAEEADVPRGAAHLLGIDIAATIGERRLAELAARWPGNVELLVREFIVAGASTHDELVDPPSSRP